MSQEPIRPWPGQETTSSRLLWMSNSYAEAADVLSKALVEDDFSQDYLSTRVILHLCRHSLELFLKGALTAKTGKAAPNTHRLDKLYETYRALYPAEHFHFDTPFGQEIFDSGGGLFPETLQPVQSNHDQRYRYPTDTGGKPFIEVEVFDAQKYATVISDFRSSINIRVASIHFKWGDDFRHPF
ncbi:hypothetical protein LJR130_001036 [Variovorax sp. LjRoot130]|uniref:hypothetical protein n=1 Tax=Variovorax sp. LjRoot130 TaxID=3342261 RepID=UPI003ED0A7C4